MNYASIFEGFMARGLPESAIEPRVNVFTYNAWLALGRQVRKGEHGVKVVTFVPMSKEDPKEPGKVDKWRAPRTTTVFHISQTDSELARLSSALADHALLWRIYRRADKGPSYVVAATELNEMAA
jgi:antirestriction protein ArdC